MSDIKGREKVYMGMHTIWPQIWYMFKFGRFDYRPDTAIINTLTRFSVGSQSAWCNVLLIFQPTRLLEK